MRYGGARRARVEAGRARHRGALLLCVAIAAACSRADWAPCGAELAAPVGQGGSDQDCGTDAGAGLDRPEVFIARSFELPLVQDDAYVYGVRLDSEHVMVVRVAKADGAMTDVSERQLQTVGPMAVSGGWLYFSADGGIQAINEDARLTYTLQISVGRYAASMAVVGQQLFVPGGDYGSAVLEVPLDGSAPAQLWSAAWPVGAGGGPLEEPALPTWVAPAGDGVVALVAGVWNSADGEMAHVKATGAATALATGLAAPAGLAVQGDAAFFLQDGCVLTVPVSGGQPPKKLGTCFGGRGQLALDEAAVYGLANDALFRVTRATGVTTKIAEAPGVDPAAVLVGDARTLHWVAPEGLMKLRKPAL